MQLKKIMMLLFSIFVFSQSEIIKQEFNSQSEFDDFWNISSWGNEDFQYSQDNVWLDSGKLVLKLNASSQSTKPICGEIASKRTNFLYGSYRASIKFMNIPGSVIGWFVYKDGVPGDGNLHEIDVEFLTKDLNNIYFTLHHDEYSVDHSIIPINFDPTADFHEYRFDWYPDSVSYYIDSVHVSTLTNKVPDAACAIMLNHWSKNLSEWGGPAPTEDTYMYVDYMHYYSDYNQVKILSGNNKSKSSIQIKVAKLGNSLKVSTESGNYINKIAVFNVSGKMIKTTKEVNTGQITLNLSKVKTGIVFLQIRTKDGLIYQKLVIDR